MYVTKMRVRPGEIVLNPDPVIEAYKNDIDRTMLTSSLRLSPEERWRRMESFIRDLASVRRVPDCSDDS